MVQPGSVKSGGTWHVEQRAVPSNNVLPRAAARLVEAARRRLPARESRAGRTAAPASFAVIMSVGERTSLNPARGGDRELRGVVRAADRRTCPSPCISRFATNAFQYGTLPQPVYVCRLTPASPKAGGISVAADPAVRPERLAVENSSASNLPGPQLVRTVRTVGSLDRSSVATALRSGDRPTIAPTFRSRFAQPSSRWPMPGANESSTVEWHSAH